MQTNDSPYALGGPSNLTFSQAQGYEAVPGPLKLEELPPEARTRLWNVFYRNLVATRHFDNLGRPWSNILSDMHAFYYNRALDEWRPWLQRNIDTLRSSIENRSFNQVFDLIQFVLRHPQCPPEFIFAMAQEFELSRLAYRIDVGPPPTIIPTVTKVDGDTIINSLNELRQAGLAGSASHLLRASECINQGDWAGSIRESIHTVESVARQLDPKAATTLGPALASLENRKKLHPALKEAFSRLYGYTSDEQGIRHALLNQPDSNADMDEALFMLSACAAFASYLWRKHTARGTP